MSVKGGSYFGCDQGVDEVGDPASVLCSRIFSITRSIGGGSDSKGVKDVHEGSLGRGLSSVVLIRNSCVIPVDFMCHVKLCTKWWIVSGCPSNFSRRGVWRAAACLGQRGSLALPVYIKWMLNTIVVIRCLDGCEWWVWWLSRLINLLNIGLKPVKA